MMFGYFESYLRFTYIDKALRPLTQSAVDPSNGIIGRERRGSYNGRIHGTMRALLVVHAASRVGGVMARVCHPAIWLARRCLATGSLARTGSGRSVS